MMCGATTSCIKVWGHYRFSCHISICVQNLLPLQPCNTPHVLMSSMLSRHSKGLVEATAPNEPGCIPRSVKPSEYAGGGTETSNTVIRNATDIGSTVYDTNRIGGSFQYGFTPAQGWELSLTRSVTSNIYSVVMDCSSAWHARGTAFSSRECLGCNLIEIECRRSNSCCVGIKAGEKYTVVVHAADLYWSYPGERIFSVSANGVPALTDYDVIAEAGETPTGAARG